MTIKKLIAIPEMVRNANDDGFCYPEKYQGQIYEWNEQYILLKDVKYDVVPKILFDELIKVVVPKTEDYDILSDTRVTDFINKTIAEALSSSFININRVIDNMNDRLSETIGLKDLQTFRENIEVNINALFNEKTEVAKGFNPEDILSELERLDKNFASHISHSAANKSQVQLTIKDVEDIIARELLIVRENLPKIIEESMEESMKDKVQDTGTSAIVEYSGVLVSDHKLSLGHLIALKEAGYSVQEIHELKAAGLV